METILAISVGLNVGCVASCFIRRSHIRRLLNWLRGRKTPPLDLDDVISNIEPEKTPLMEVMRRQRLPDGHPAHLPIQARGMPPYDWQKEPLPKKDGRR